ncbi:hypothetical protein KDX01_10990 [Burkholderia vietnamiensis]|uniref:hypothetical protein n=1 Tax=Burkholderia vietnamiensis TaxID=60552 RepID=UPI000A9B07D4|nr:hypothetical protein [Burkholderia vietnamiensis]MBR7973637.1 hypothetical protein [Burkholderia vietnamiensis]
MVTWRCDEARRRLSAERGLIPARAALRLAGKRYGADIGKTIAFGVIVACGARSSPVDVVM